MHRPESVPATVTWYTARMQFNGILEGYELFHRIVQLPPWQIMSSRKTSTDENKPTTGALEYDRIDSESKGYIGWNA
ncbi:hypothetical protein J1614_004120 [Plenodomus biglobosus]|nr:hypothetical protein J1614_004120 [Plenodomus biglobosus]